MPSSVYRNRWAAEKSVARHAIRRSLWVGSKLPPRTPYDLEIDLDNPISHWKLGEASQATDRKNVTHLPATATPIASEAGLVANNGAGLASKFTAAQGAFFRRGSASGLGIPYNTPNWSLECWFRVDALPTTQATFTGRFGVTEIHVRSVGDARAGFHDGVTGMNLRTLVSPVELGRTYHVVITYNGATFIVYRDGVEVSRQAFGTVASQTADVPYIGGEGPPVLTGVIDEVAWYGTALSPARILAHYNIGKGIVPKSLPLPPRQRRYPPRWLLVPARRRNWVSKPLSRYRWVGSKLSDVIAPVPNVTSVDATRISRVAGKDLTNVNFTANEAFVEYEVRRVSSASDGRGAGNLVETTTVSSRTSHSIQLTDDEIIAAAAIEGTNLFKVFVRDAAGNWSS